METKRLILRQWKSEDYDAYAELNADPPVMRYFPKTYSRFESDDQADLIRKLISEKGWGFWAVELKSTIPSFCMTRFEGSFCKTVKA